MEATKEARHEQATRICRLLYFFAADYLSELDRKQEEDAAAKAMQEASDADGITRCMILTADNNARVSLDCVRNCVSAVKILTSSEEDVDDWMIAGISAMLDHIAEHKEDGFPFDLPDSICGLLLSQYRDCLKKAVVPAT